MLVVSNNIFGICSNSTINKLVVIHICSNQSKMEIGILITCRAQPSDRLNYIMGNFFSSLN